MAYPHAPLPTFAVVKEKLEQLGCEYKQLPTPLRDSEGDEAPVCYFERRDEEKVCTASLSPLEGDSPITFTVVRSICARLRIAPRRLDIGLDID